jgi:hypothetical protein
LRAAAGALCVVVMSIAGCPAPGPPAPVTIELVNQTGFDVRPSYYRSASAGTAADLFIDANLRTDFTDRAFPELRPNETIALSVECDQIASLGAQRPAMFDSTTLTVIRSENEVLRVRGDGIACGGTVRLVYYTEGTAFRVRVE